MRLSKPDDVQVARTFKWALVIIVLLGAWWRWVALSPMQHLLSYDEAFNGLDVLSLLHTPRLTPFFPGNFGRESGWMYLLTPFVAVFGAQPFALRLAVTLVGILTIPALYVLGAELVSARVGVWAAAAFVALYWPLQMNTLALRANLMPLIGALSFAVFVRALRTNRRRYWILVGVSLGALAYTYFAARVWLGIQIVILLTVALVDAARRRGAWLALFVVALIAVPLMAYTALNPAVALNRISEVSVANADGIIANIGHWLQAFFQQGDPQFALNLPGRPIFDPFLGALFIIGLIGLPWAFKRWWQAWWLAAIAFGAVSPSLFSQDAPHFLRAIGLIVPLVIVVALGAERLRAVASRVLPARIAVVIPLGLIVVGGLLTYTDFFTRWFQQSEALAYLGQYDNQVAQLMKDASTEHTPVYLPYSLYVPWDDPRTQFRVAYLAPRPVGQFDWRQCQVVATVPAVYAVPAAERADFVENLSLLAEVASIGQILDLAGTSPVFDVVSTQPRTVEVDLSQINFSDQMQVRVLSTVPERAQPNDLIPIEISARALRPLDRDYSVFIHLYGQTRPEAGGAPLSQSDGLLCPSHPSSLWQVQEFAVQTFALPIPADLPAGEYVVALGVYDSETQARLAVTAPSGGRDSVDLGHIQVGP